MGAKPHEAGRRFIASRPPASFRFGEPDLQRRKERDKEETMRWQLAACVLVTGLLTGCASFSTPPDDRHVEMREQERMARNFDPDARDRSCAPCAAGRRDAVRGG